MLFLTVTALVAGLSDRGIYPELGTQVELHAPARVDPARDWLRVDDRHHIVTLYADDVPLAALPLDRSSQWDALGLRKVPSVPTAAEDRDGDGIVDALDILIGARKLLANGAHYIERYVSLPYPGGDVPRTEGVCTDTVIRSLRNAGIDLQKEVHEDILRAPAAYPMVEKVDASINHRRVRTVVRWFERHFTRLPSGTPFRPGDVVFFDTFPSKEGPDHLGIVSDTIGKSGRPLVINNWTDGAVDAEMDLLTFVPVTHHFRVPEKPQQSLLR
jgi:uncharacterized protein YijF (DUF1287 family)